jgi:hypothetical protein
VLSGRGLCDELITRPEESYRLCCVVVCDLETSRIGAPYIYDISNLRVNVIGLQDSVIKCSLEIFEEINFIFCRNLYFYCIFQSLCKSKLLCGRETYITHFNI